MWDIQFYDDTEGFNAYKAVFAELRATNAECFLSRYQVARPVLEVVTKKASYDSYIIIILENTLTYIFIKIS